MFDKINKTDKYLQRPIKKRQHWGTWVAQSVVSDFGSGHDLPVRGFEPHIGLCADCSEPGACFGFCASLPLGPFLARALSLSLSLKNK